MSNGVVTQIIGAVIDVEFDRENIPSVYEALNIIGLETVLEVQQQLIWKALEYANDYKIQTTKTDPSDAINSALDNFWEDSYGSNGSTESEELLQLSSNGD